MKSTVQKSIKLMLSFLLVALSAFGTSAIAQSLTIRDGYWASVAKIRYFGMSLANPSDMLARMSTQEKQDYLASLAKSGITISEDGGSVVTTKVCVPDTQLMDLFTILRSNRASDSWKHLVIEDTSDRYKMRSTSEKPFVEVELTILKISADQIRISTVTRIDSSNPDKRLESSQELKWISISCPP